MVLYNVYTLGYPDGFIQCIYNGYPDGFIQCIYDGYPDGFSQCEYSRIPLWFYKILLSDAHNILLSDVHNILLSDVPICWFANISTIRCIPLGGMLISQQSDIFR